MEGNLNHRASWRIFFKGDNIILHLSVENFKGVDNRKLGCLKSALCRGEGRGCMFYNVPIWVII